MNQLDPFFFASARAGWAPFPLLFLFPCHGSRRQSNIWLLLQWLVGSVVPEWLTHPIIMNSRECSPGNPVGLP